MANNYNLVIAVYDGPASAQVVYNAVKDLEDGGELEVKEAAVVTRSSGGKISMSNKGFVGTGKGGVLGLVVGAVTVSAPIAGLLVGGLIGFARSGDRRRLKQLLDENLGPDQSALAVVISPGGWSKVEGATPGYEGEVIDQPLSDDAIATLEQLAEEEDLDAARAEVVEDAAD